MRKEDFRHGAKFAETAKVETISRRNVKRFILSVIHNHMISLTIHPIVNSMTIGYMPYIPRAKQNRSTEGCSRLKNSVEMTSSGKNGLNIRTNASPKWDRTRCPEE